MKKEKKEPQSKPTNGGHKSAAFFLVFFLVFFCSFLATRREFRPLAASTGDTHTHTRAFDLCRLFIFFSCFGFTEFLSCSFFFVCVEQSGAVFFFYRVFVPSFGSIVARLLVRPDSDTEVRFSSVAPGTHWNTHWNRGGLDGRHQSRPHPVDPLPSFVPSFYRSDSKRNPPFQPSWNVHYSKKKKKKKKEWPLNAPKSGRMMECVSSRNPPTVFLVW